MRILLNENLPLPLAHDLRRRGHAVEHIIELDQRGVSDAVIIERLLDDPVLFLTQDQDFFDIEPDLAAVVIVSRVPQQLRIARRVEIWRAAIEQYLREGPPGDFFELLEDGRLVPVEIHRL